VVDEIRLAEMAVTRQGQGLSTQTEKLANLAAEQQDSVLRVSAAMEEVSVSISEVARSSGQASDSARSTRAVIDRGSEQLALNNASTLRVVAVVEESAKAMSELSGSIQQIGSITNVIKDIAEQTNLLALNAAIEAARAGEQGRGFAVVADEVRKLAERTANSTAEITRMVAQVQQTTGAAVVSMDNAAREVQTGRELLDATNVQFQEINRAADDVLHSAQHIADATREQSVAAEDVAKNMEHISQMIEQNNQSVQGVSDSTLLLTRTASELHSIVEHFGAMG
jgi:aerotaxis receptor